MKSRKWFQCLFTYTLLFAVLAACLAGPYMLRGKSLVNNGDGMMQHIKALDYYGRWLRSIGRRIMQGDFTLPAYSFAFGYGGDVVTTLHYYVVGDPLTLLSVFFDTAHIVYLYNALIVLRLYLAGIAFLLFARCTISMEEGADPALQAPFGLSAGALLYAFCGFSLFTATRHPFFINPLIWFPVVLLGVEKVIREKRITLLAFGVAIAAASNFYFFYMIVLLTVGYVVWRLVSTHGLRRIADGLPDLARIAAGSVLGVMLAGIVFLPVVLKFLQNPRMAGGAAASLLYDKEYYAKFPLSILTPFSNGAWTHLGITGVGVCAVLTVLLRGKRFRRFQVLLVLCLLLLCVPEAGYLLSGTSYVTNRWSWGLILLVCWLVAFAWEEIRDIRKPELAALVGVFALGCVCLLLLRGRANGIYIRALAWALGVSACLILFLVWNRRTRASGRVFSAGMLALTMCALAGNIWFMNHMEGKDNLEGTIPMAQMTDKVTVEEIGQLREEEPDPAAVAEALRERLPEGAWNTMGLAVREAAALQQTQGSGTTLDRYSGHGVSKNDSVIEGLPSVHYYWSLANGHIASYLDEIANITYRSYDFRSMDDRTLSLALTGTQYYVSRSKAYVPYGYERLTPQENPLDDVYPVYRNRYTLPFGYTFEKVLSEDDYGTMDALERQEAMLQGILVPSEELAGLEESWPVLDREQTVFGHRDLPFTMEASDGLKLEDGRITVSRAGAVLTLSFEGAENTETCLYVQNLHYEDGASKAEIEVQGSAGGKTVTKKTLTVLTPDHDWYAGRHDFIVNTGFSKTKKDEVTLVFSGKGTYTFDSLRVAAQPMEQYVTWTEALREDPLEDVYFHADADTFTTSRVSGTITLEKPKILCFAIPYEKGWTAVVDGERRQLICGNALYLALPLEEGTHQIELRYCIPGSRAGLGMGVLALLVLIGAGIRRTGCRRKKYQRSK